MGAHVYKDNGLIQVALRCIYLDKSFFVLDLELRELARCCFNRG